MKKISAVLLCAVMLLALVVPAAAETAGEFLFDGYTVLNDKLCVVMPGQSTSRPDVTSDGLEIVDWTESSVEAAEVPITYFCIMDQSSAFSMGQKDQQEDALRKISASMRPIDSMILGTMGLTLTISEPMNDPAVREKAIADASVYKAYASYQYDTIVAALEHLKSVPGLRCLILFSDGINDAGGKVTEDMAREAIRNSNLSYNTFSLVVPMPDGYAVNNANRMGSMSDESMGGVHVAPNVDKTNVAEDVAKIMTAMLNAAVIQVDAYALNADGGEAAVTFSPYQGAEQKSTVTVDASLLPVKPEPPTEPETTEPETTEPETVETEPETTEPATAPAVFPSSVADAFDFGSNRIYMILIGVGVAAVAIMMLLVTILSRVFRRSRDDEPERRAVAEVPEEDEIPPLSFQKEEAAKSTDDDFGIDLDFLLAEFRTPEEELPEEQEPEEAPEETPAEPGCMLQLTDVEHEEVIEFFLPVNTPVTVGRSNRAEVILNEADNGLSSIHFELHWDSRSLFLRDRNSTNGTAVNGVMQKPDNWIRLENGDTILAGSYVYRVNAQKA